MREVQRRGLTLESVAYSCADVAGILNRSFVKATWEIMSCDRIRMGRDWLQEKLDQAERKRDEEKRQYHRQYYPHVTFLHMHEDCILSVLVFSCIAVRTIRLDINRYLC